MADTASLISDDEECEASSAVKIKSALKVTSTQSNALPNSEAVIEAVVTPKNSSTNVGSSTSPITSGCDNSKQCSESFSNAVTSGSDMSAAASKRASSDNATCQQNIPSKKNSRSSGTHHSSRQSHPASSSSSFMSRLKINADAQVDDLPDASSSLTIVQSDAIDSNTAAAEEVTQPQVRFDEDLQHQGPSTRSNTIWHMNYHEAAIFLQEGEDNDKFDSHPGQRSALPAYLLTHSPWFYALDLAASLLLLTLAVAERPSLELFDGMNEGIHATVELFALSVLGISIGMQLKWLGWRKFVRHKRSMMKSTAWLVMVAEAITVIVRSSSHFRATRALRPIFLLDSRYLGGVRRFMRQLLQSVPPVLEIVAILMLVLTIFTTLGYYLFSYYPEDPYFTTLPQSFVSLFVLLTTANYPDVMMPSYARNRWNAAFFILYLAITLYCIMNFMMAIVFVVFSAMEKDKFRKLLLHKRRACQLAFRLLVSRKSPNAITYQHFTGLIKFYKPKAKVREVYLTFKALNKCSSGRLRLNEFYQVYTACGLAWRPSEPEPAWYCHLPVPGPAIGAAVRKMVTTPIWEAIVYLVICSNGIELLVLTLLMSAQGGVPENSHITWYQLTFIAFYTCEVLLKLVGLGLSEYLRSGWNIFDASVTLLSIAGLLAETFHHPFYYVVILRPLRLLRLFRIRRRYREVFETMAILLPRVLSASVVIIVIYYFFAVIGMEMFYKYDLKNCCVNSTVEQFYRADNSTRYQSYYYLNNFDNVFMAGVTLFELTVVNNWFIIMEGYAYVSGEWSRLFFMLFYLAMMVVMSVVLAFIIEAFTFRMQYNQTVNRDRRKPKSEVTRVKVPLTSEELEFVYRDTKDTTSLLQYTHDKTRGQDTGGVVEYIGLGERSKMALQLRMYRHLLHTWIRDAGTQHHNTDAEGSTQHPNTSQQRNEGESVGRGGSDQLKRRKINTGGSRDDDEDDEGGTPATTSTRVTVLGRTELVTDDCNNEDSGADGGRPRGGSIASNLIEWWKTETGEDENQHVETEASDPIWGIDEDEVEVFQAASVTATRPVATSNIILNSIADDSSPNLVSLSFASTDVAASITSVASAANRATTPSAPPIRPSNSCSFSRSSMPDSRIAISPSAISRSMQLWEDEHDGQEAESRIDWQEPNQNQSNPFNNQQRQQQHR